MKIDDIRKELAHMPHIEKVWVKDNQVFIHKVAGSTEHDLKQAEKPVKPSKKLKDGAE
jgi:hypothetical protein